MEAVKDENQYFDICCSSLQNKWHNISDVFPSNLCYISLDEKEKKESKVTKLIEQVTKHIDEFPDLKFKRKVWKQKGEAFLKNIISQDDLFKLNNMDKDMQEGFLQTTKEFVRKARAFDSDLSIEDIGQAMRNVWIVSILQELLNQEHTLTKAVFGYSMLYPYTDNYLDDASIPVESKKEFNQRLYKRLKGEFIENNELSNIQNKRERKVFELVEAIESVYDRKEFEPIYNSLLMIFESQVQSLKQQTTISDIDELLKISIRKGGSSVLVDGYFVNSKLSKKDFDFCVGYGFFLQLADDLQDIKEDTESNSKTIISKIAETNYLDKVVNKMINFMLELVDCFDSQKPKVKDVIKDNCTLLVLFSVVLNKERFSPKYLAQIENYLPFSFEYIENLMKDKRFRNNTLINDRERLMGALDEMMLN